MLAGGEVGCKVVEEVRTLPPLFWLGSLEKVAVPVDEESPPPPPVTLMLAPGLLSSDMDMDMDMDIVIEVDAPGETMPVLSPPSTGPGPPLKLDSPEMVLLD